MASSDKPLSIFRDVLRLLAVSNDSAEPHRAVDARQKTEQELQLEIWKKAVETQMPIDRPAERPLRRRSRLFIGS